MSLGQSCGSRNPAKGHYRNGGLHAIAPLQPAAHCDFCHGLQGLGALDALCWLAACFN